MGTSGSAAGNMGNSDNPGKHKGRDNGRGHNR